MITFKFTPKLTEAVKNGEETATFRMEAKDVAMGDVVEMWTRFDENTTERFGYAKIIGVKEMRLGDAPLSYPTRYVCVARGRLAKYRGYYGVEITLQSMLYIYDFEFLGGK